MERPKMNIKQWYDGRHIEYGKRGTWSELIVTKLLPAIEAQCEFASEDPITGEKPLSCETLIGPREIISGIGVRWMGEELVSIGIASGADHLSARGAEQRWPGIKIVGIDGTLIPQITLRLTTATTRFPDFISVPVSQFLTALIEDRLDAQ